MRRPHLLRPAVALSCGLLTVPVLARGATATTTSTTLPSKTLVGGPPGAAKGPDDVTRLATPGVDGGKAVIWVGFQNGINPDGTAGSPGGPTASTVAGFDPGTGAVVETLSVPGKVDGLTADRDLHRLIATVNEDANSKFNLIDPATAGVTTYTYAPDPAPGGTDSIAVHDGHIYVVHSNPSDTTEATDYEVFLDDRTGVAHLRPVFFNHSPATDAVSGQTAPLALTDPDTNAVMPPASPRFAGTMATISQGDGEIIFAPHPQTSPPPLTVLHLTDNVPNNVPPIDGLAVATADAGTLYVVDAGAGVVQALDTSGLPAGTVFVSEPSDNGNPLVGTLDLSTGAITPLGNSFTSPKGLLFVPAHGDQGQQN